jgi:hypothetical protein
MGVAWTCHLVPFQCSATRVWIASELKKLPAAMQWFRSVQETWSSSAGASPLGWAIASIVQLEPFQRAAVVPTAMHTVAEVQETPSRWLMFPAPLGVAWLVQLLPFQASASVALVVPVADEPTASHTVAEKQETPRSPLEVWLVALGVAWMVQVLPFQTSARVWNVLPPVENWPTASHAVADVQETPASWLLVAPAGS